LNPCPTFCILLFLTCRAADLPFTIAWLQGKCIDCEIAKNLSRIQWVSRTEAFGIGWSFPPPGAEGSGDYVVVRTTDGGRTWRELPDTWQHAGPPAFWFLDGMRGWVSCSNLYCTQEVAGEEVRRTSDGGNHWDMMTQTTGLLTMAFADQLHGIGQAFYGDDRPPVRTVDGGRTWSRIEIPHLKQVDSLIFLSGQIAWVTDRRDNDLLFFRTTDGGQSWQESRTALPRGWPNVREFSFMDQNHGWMVLSRNGADKVRLLKTTDGGRTWSTVSIPPVLQAQWVPSPEALGFISDKVGFVFSTATDGPPSWDPAKRRVLFTADGGAHWQDYPLPFSISDCQALAGDLVCSADRQGSHFGILTLHPK